MHRLSFLASFRWKLCLALAVAILGDWIFYQQGLSGGAIGVFAFAVLLCLVLGRPGVWRRWQASVAALFAVLFCGTLILDPGLLAWGMFWVAISMAALFGMTTPYDDGWLWFQRLLFHAARSPFAPVLDMIRLSRVVRRPRVRRFGLRATLSIIALPLVGSAIILTLFASANPVIADALAMIQLPDFSDVSPWRIILWLVFFALGWSVLRPRVARRLIPTFDGSGDLPIIGVSVASVTLSLILFNLLFAVENSLDIAYLSRALPLPDGMSIADYVHRGAYPLIVTALFAGLFVLVTLRPGSATAAVPLIRRLVVLWIVQNVVLVATSIQRTLDYVDASMFTALRIHALAWMLLVAAGLLLICWRMLRGESASWLINSNLALAMAVLTIFSFVDAGEAAAWWNVRHAREVTGHGGRLDLCYLNRLGPSALLPLIELESRPLDRSFRERVQSVRSGVYERLAYAQSRGGWSWRDAQRLSEAQARLKAIRPIPLTAGGRDCDGALFSSDLLPQSSTARPAPPPPSPKPSPKAPLTQAQLR